MAQDVVAMIGLGLALFVNTSALFYWGGRVTQMLRDHERRITNLET